MWRIASQITICLECELSKIYFSPISDSKMIMSYIYNSVRYNDAFSYKKSYKIW